MMVMVIFLHGWSSCRPRAIVMVLLLMMLFLVITRIVAETGLVHGQLQVESTAHGRC